MTALDFMMKAFPEIREPEDMRKGIGRYGLTGKQQVVIINHIDVFLQSYPKPLGTLPWSPLQFLGS